MPKIKVKSVTFWRLGQRSPFGRSAAPNLDPADLARRLDVLRGRILDMLRYDTAFIQDAGDPRFVALPSWAGDRTRVPTFARWHSFGIVLEEIRASEEEAAELRHSFLNRPATWVIYRHPFNGQGARDYGKLESITLATILAAKDWTEV